MPTVLRRVRDGYTYAGELDLAIMTCPACGITYAMPAALQSNAYDRGHRAIVWYCPNGHELGYNGASEAEKAEQKAKREGERATRLQARLDQTEAALRAQKAAKTRFKNERDRDRRRVAHGVCPCCGRTFKQLARHMASQHPGFVADADREAGVG
jgi:hypothetical protein